MSAEKVKELLDRGQALCDLQKFDDAVRCLNEAIQLNLYDYQ